MAAPQSIQNSPSWFDLGRAPRLMTGSKSFGASKEDLDLGATCDTLNKIMEYELAAT